MNGNKVNDSNFDRWLATALQARANAEPRLGLEERVLARLATEMPRKSFISWPVFAAVAAALIVFFTLFLTLRKAPNSQIVLRTPEANVTSRTPAPPRALVNSTIAETRRPLRKHEAAELFVRRAATQGQQLPRLATFPSARPQTTQERLLARLVARRGSFDVASNSEEMVRLKDLSVPELNVRPLEGTPPDKAPQY